MRIVTDEQEQDGFFWVERLLPKHHGLPNHDLIKGFWDNGTSLELHRRHCMSALVK